jgi:cell division protein FtsX
VTLPTALALTCVGIAALDLAIGYFVVLPRARPQAKTALTAAFLGNALVLLVLAYLFGTGILTPPGQPEAPAATIQLTPTTE